MQAKYCQGLETDDGHGVDPVRNVRDVIERALTLAGGTVQPFAINNPQASAHYILSPAFCGLPIEFECPLLVFSSPS
jgi:hypothetical protein